MSTTRIQSSEKGFSLSEVLVAFGIIAGLVLVASAVYIFMWNNQKEVEALDFGFEESRSAVRILNLLEQSDLSIHFMNLPVPKTNCQASGPCVLVLNSQTQSLSPLDSTLAQTIFSSSIQMFSDRSGEVEDSPILNGQGQSVANVRTFKSIDLSRLPLGQSIEVCWRLVDESSPPFVFMTKNEWSVPWRLDPRFASSQPRNTYTFFETQASYSASDLTGLKGFYVVLVNVKDRRQFAVAKVSDIKSCQLDSNFCEQEKNQSGQVTASLSNKHLAVKIDPLGAEEDQWLGASSRGLGISGTWVSGGGITSPLVPAIWTVVKSGDSDLQPPLDARKWAHFYHAQNLDMNIMAIPFYFVRIFVEGSGVSKRLIREKFFAGRSQERIIEVSQFKGGGAICRKLGTTSVGIHFIE